MVLYKSKEQRKMTQQIADAIVTLFYFGAVAFAIILGVAQILKKRL